MVLHWEGLKQKSLSVFFLSLAQASGTPSQRAVDFQSARGTAKMFLVREILDTWEFK